MGSTGRSGGVWLAAVAATALLVAGASSGGAQRSEPTFAWKFDSAARQVPAKAVWKNADLTLFQEHLRHRAGSFLSEAEWQVAYTEGVEAPGDTDLGTFVGKEGVAWAAFEKWSRRHAQASCRVFHMCYSN